MPETRPSPLLRAAVLALLAALLVGCGGQGGAARSGSAGPVSPTSGAPAPSTSPTASAKPSVPVRVVAPTIDVDERLIDLGIAENGELEAPEDPARVGWFAEGGRPGETYPTVLAGHVDSTSGPAVFARLRELRAGQQVQVESADGVTRTYRIDAVRDVPQSADFPTEEVYGQTRRSQLRLITCSGPYDRDAGRYTQNRVVFATLV